MSPSPWVVDIFILASSGCLFMMAVFMAVAVITIWRDGI